MLQQYNSNITCTPLWVTTNYRQSNRTHGKALTQSNQQKRAGHKGPFPDLPGSTGEGRGELGAACPFVPVCLRPCTELPAPGWPPARQSAVPARVALPAPRTVTPSESQSSSGEGQDTTECEPTTLTQLCYNKDTRCPEGTHTSQHIPEKKLWLTRSAAPSQRWTAVPWKN